MISIILGSEPQVNIKHLMFPSQIKDIREGRDCPAAPAIPVARPDYPLQPLILGPTFVAYRDDDGHSR